MARGRRITVPPQGTRPTTDRVREALFNILAARLDFTGMSVLDLQFGLVPLAQKGWRASVIRVGAGGQ